MVSKPILVVDDEPIVRESIRDWLKDAGYQVATAETGEEALEMIEKQDFSVMILDVRLPGKRPRYQTSDMVEGQSYLLAQHLLYGTSKGIGRGRKLCPVEAVSPMCYEPTQQNTVLLTAGYKCLGSLHSMVYFATIIFNGSYWAK